MSTDYVYRTSTAPPPMYNDQTPLIHNTFIVHDGQRWSNRHFSRLFIILAMTTLWIGLIVLSFSLFINNNESKYLLFVRRWPPTLCNQTNSCNSDYPEKWVIHGLWPENSDNTWDEYCPSQHSKLNLTVLQPIHSQLLLKWPNLLKGKTEESLWQHEWSKHGTCSHKTQYDYFKQSLMLFDDHDLAKQLFNAGVHPTTGHKYTLSQFRQALGEEKSYVFNCHKYGADYYLQEIMYCVKFDQVKTATQCTMDSDCPEEFYYP